NIFRALAVERHEIRHSNFFAFLLDPRENHGLGDILLRKFLRDIFSDRRADDRTLFDADLMDFRQVDVRREWKNIDILIEFPADVIAVES
ncbi:PD-(D/E)XK nuclease family protein, partial [Acinetobacter baumannii]